MKTNATKHTPATITEAKESQRVAMIDAQREELDILRAENARLREALHKCIAGMPHNPPQDEAVALLRELGEDS